ncbi:hypothetical protein GCM10023175_01380 [Pseudonocardia xishanensis]|uniref:Uncharacterized protein n=1 Tax=Pseudonocardia xishanensis TaxID=630995 RepID=A0ABP8RCI3_9PSEU
MSSAVIATSSAVSSCGQGAMRPGTDNDGPGRWFFGSPPRNTDTTAAGDDAEGSATRKGRPRSGFGSRRHQGLRLLDHSSHPNVPRSTRFPVNLRIRISSADLPTFRNAGEMGIS